MNLEQDSHRLEAASLHRRLLDVQKRHVEFDVSDLHMVRKGSDRMSPKYPQNHNANEPGYVLEADLSSKLSSNCRLNETDEYSLDAELVNRYSEGIR
jgi:hypothetical protein